MRPPEQIRVEAPPPVEVINPEQILLGPSIDPLIRIRTYSADQFEEFIQEWAFFYLQELSKQYHRVVRLGGSGDKGRDIIAYFEDGATNGCDVYQCKHYGHPLRPGDVWVELGKMCYFASSGAIPLPRRFHIVAPMDAGPELVRLLDTPLELRSKLIAQWATSCATKIVVGQRIPLEGPLLRFVEDFDFSIVTLKPILEVITEHGKTIRRAPRFGGGLNKAPPEDPIPPEELEGHETHYVEQLLAAYADKLGLSNLDRPSLSSHSDLENHFQRSRQRYYCAEALRLFARDNLPENVTFEQVQDQIYDAVVDVCEMTYSSGYERVVKTTSTATQVSVNSHILRSYLKPQSLQGICHQLANIDRLRWVK